MRRARLALAGANTRSMCFVTAAVAVTIATIFTGPFERYTAGDLNRIRADESSFSSACAGKGDVEAASKSLTSLLELFRRDPDQPLPLHGAAGAASMRAELSAMLELTGTGPCAGDHALRDRLAQAVASR